VVDIDHHVASFTSVSRTSCWVLPRSLIYHRPWVVVFFRGR
jgi:hypothetical protein